MATTTPWRAKQELFLTGEKLIWENNVSKILKLGPLIWIASKKYELIPNFVVKNPNLVSN
jgi:hypothetical protein